MQEQLIAGCIGFIIAYLVVKAIRSFRTIGMCLMLVVLVNNTKGNIYVKNTSAGIVHSTVQWYNDSGYNSLYGTWTVGDVGSGVTYGPGNYYDGKYVKVTWRQSGGGTILAVNQLGLDQAGNYTNVYSGIVNVNYYWDCITVTNPCPNPEIVNIEVYVGGVYSGQVVELIPSYGSYTKCLTNSAPFTWTANSFIAGIEKPCNLPPSSGTSQTNSMPEPGPGNDTDPGGGNTTKGPINPDDAVGTNVVNNPDLNNQQWDRQNTAWLINELNKLFGELNLRLASNGTVIDYRPWLNATTNFLGQINDKTFDYREYWKTNNNQNTAITNLLSVGNNTGTGMSNILSGVTNYLSAISNNTRILDSNTVGGLWSNNFLAESNSAYGDLSTFYNTSGLASLTNFTWQLSATDVVVPADDYLSFTLGTVGGHQHKMDFNIEHAMAASTLADDAWKLVGWGSKWLAWLINFALWVAIMWRIDEMIGVVRGDLRSPNSGGKVNTGSTLAGWLAKTTIQYAVVTSIVALIVMLPTALVTWMSGHGISNPLTGVTPISDVQNNSMNISATLGKMLIYWTSIILHAIPFGVAMVATINWLIFVQYSRYIADLIGQILWRWGRLIPMILILMAPLNADSAQAKIENLTGTNVVLTANNQDYVFAPGITQLEEIPSGAYDLDATNITIPVDGKLVVRVTMRSNGTKYCETGTELSTMDCCIYAMGVGFAIFGSAWGVSAAWQGWRMRHGAD